MTSLHLAQVNIARMRAPLDDPRMAGFVARLAEINRLAEQSPGFVWRFQDEIYGNAVYIRVFDDDRILFNMSVWETVEALKDFVYRSTHRELIQARHEWFEPLGGPPFVLWWIPAGTLPSVEDAKERLDHLRQHGETPFAFTFRHSFPGPDYGPEGQKRDIPTPSV